MSLPGTALLVCSVLLWSATTAAQPRLPREKKERQAPLPRTTAEPMPMVRVAAGVLTSLSFDAALASAQVEHRERFTRLDVGERSLYLEPALELAPTERLALHVTFADGREAMLLLTSHPTEVDTRVDFTLPERATEASERDLSATLARCEAQRQEFKQLQAQCAHPGPALLALTGELDEKAVWKDLAWKSETAMLTKRSGRQYHLRSWDVLLLSVQNTGAAPWTPSRVRLTPGLALPTPPRVVFPSGPTLPPGRKGDIAVELALPTPSASFVPGAKQTVTLCDDPEEHCLSVPGVELAEAR